MSEKIEKILQPLSPRFSGLLLEEFLPSSHPVAFEPLLRLPILQSSEKGNGLEPPPPLFLKDLCTLAAESFSHCIEILLREQHSISSVQSIRAALALILTFLRRNDVELDVGEMELFEMALETGALEISTAEFSDFLYRHAYPALKDAVWKRAAP